MIGILLVFHVAILCPVKCNDKHVTTKLFWISVEIWVAINALKCCFVILQKKDARIIIGSFYVVQAKHVFCEVRFVFKNDYRGFLHDVTALILYWWFARDVTAAILVSQSSFVGVENFSYVNVFFCSHLKFAYPLTTLYYKLNW